MGCAVATPAQVHMCIFVSVFICIHVSMYANAQYVFAYVDVCVCLSGFFFLFICVCIYCGVSGAVRPCGESLYRSV